MFDELNDVLSEVMTTPRAAEASQLRSHLLRAGHDPLCSDQLELFLTLEDNTITDISFVGSGCSSRKPSLRC